MLPVVAIGASAGGIRAIESLLSTVPADTGAAFVILLHQSPHHSSALPELLARKTAMKVIAAEDVATLAPNVVYVVPPGAVLLQVDEVLRVANAAPSAPHNTIDATLSAVAEVYGDRAIGVVLSGVGADGSLGLAAVRAHGGVTLAQDDAEQPDMPRSAVAGGFVDHFLPIHPLAQQLTRQIAYARKLNGRPERDVLERRARERLEKVLTLVRNSTGHDFQNYKENTVLRRIQRRMQVRQVTEVDDYLALLRSDTEEPRRLLQDLLIGVTQFFRDRPAFDALENRVIHDLLRDRAPGAPVRVWVPACATGEEAYSLAIAFHDAIERESLDVELHIFATDIDEAALGVARRGVYPAAVQNDVPPERLKRFFHREGERYRVAKRIRDAVVFSVHNIIKDPPFSRLDLISCRNLLIYLAPALQAQVLPLFHYALGPGGYLFLGSAEGVAGADNLFQPVDKAQRLYKRRDVAGALRPTWWPRARREIGRPTLDGAARAFATRKEKPLSRLVERALLEAFVPVSVVVNDRFDVVYLLGRSGKYLEPSEGVPSHNVLDMARPGLRSELRVALRSAVSSGKPVRREGVRVKTGGATDVVRLTVQPLPGMAVENGLLLVTFEEVRPEKEPAKRRAKSQRGSAPRASIVRDLEGELKDTQDQLQSIVQELEGSNEELKSSNEELLSMNEELQSSNEELETAKEELQSVNEELGTVNTELKQKVDELAEANSDSRNLFDSTQLATLFLDRELKIRSFTPSASQLFHLIDADRGRPIADITRKFEFHGFEAALDTALTTLGVVEAAVQCGEDWYLMRILPYRSIRNVIEGVVVTFANVTQLKDAQRDVHELSKSLRERLLELRTVLDVLPIGIAFAARASGEVRVNRAASDLLGGEPHADGAEPLTHRLVLGSDGALVTPELERVMHAEYPIRDLELEIPHMKRSVWLLVSSAPLRDASSRVYGSVTSITDITARKLAADQLLARSKQQAAVERLKLRAMASADLSTVIEDALDTIASELGCDMCTVSQFQGTESIRVVAQMGLSESVLGESAPRAGSFEKYVLDAQQQVHFGDLRKEQRFSLQGELSAQGAVGGGVLMIEGAQGRLWGFVTVFFREPSQLSQFDIDFVHAATHVLTLALQREDAEREERELRDLRHSTAEQLRRAERLAALGTFAAGLAHELNNPLSTISMSADYALRTGDRKTFEKMLAAIHENAKRCSRIVEGVMRFARDETSKKWRNNLNAIAATAAELARSYMPADRLHLELELARDLPEVMCNPTQIEQVVVNLIRNAFEASTRVASVRLRTEKAGGRARLTVEDDGPGIAPDQLQKIFDPFHSTRRSKGGTGLGLSIAHRVVTDHGGTIQAFNRPEGGASFVVELPAAREEDDNTGASEASDGENPDRR